MLFTCNLSLALSILHTFLSTIVDAKPRKLTEGAADITVAEKLAVITAEAEKLNEDEESNCAASAQNTFNITTKKNHLDMKYDPATIPEKGLTATTPESQKSKKAQEFFKGLTRMFEQDCPLAEKQTLWRELFGMRDIERMRLTEQAFNIARIEWYQAPIV